MNAAPAALIATRRWIPAYVGIGSNLDDPAAQVERAVQALTKLPDSLLVTVSPRYRSQPLGDAAQPAFVKTPEDTTDEAFIEETDEADEV